MGLIHKTLKDAEKLLESGKYTEARIILKKHVEGEHQFVSDLSQLSRNIATFQQAIFDTIVALEMERKDSLELLKYAEERLKIVKDILHRMIYYERIKLE